MPKHAIYKTTEEKKAAQKRRWLKWKANINPLTLKLRQQKSNKKYRKNHPERAASDYIKQKKSKNYKNQYKNRKEYRKQWQKNKRENSKEFRILSNLRARLFNAIKLGNNQKKGSTQELLGCTIIELAIHLEKQFKEGMSWENYGKWHIDHITPCSYFDLSKIKEQKKCFHYTNLQPLWEFENLQKGDKISFIQK